MDWIGMTIHSNGWTDQTINMKIGTKMLTKRVAINAFKWQSVIPNLVLGKWTDDKCSKKYLVTCQKKEASKK